MNIKKYIVEVKSEMNKVSWPPKQKVIKDSAVVVIASVGTALFISGVDAVFSYVTTKVIAG